MSILDGSPAGMPSQCKCSFPAILSGNISKKLQYCHYCGDFLGTGVCSCVFLWIHGSSSIIKLLSSSFFSCQATRGSGRLYISIQHRTNKTCSCGTVAPCRNQSTDPLSRPFARHASKQEMNDSTQKRLWMNWWTNTEARFCDRLQVISRHSPSVWRLQVESNAIFRWQTATDKPPNGTNTW